MTASGDTSDAVTFQVGRWRAKDANAPIDATGVLPDGTRFEGPAGLTKLMATKYRDGFAGAVAEKLMTYALGRGLEPYDRPALRVVPSNSRKVKSDSVRSRVKPSRCSNGASRHDARR